MPPPPKSPPGPSSTAECYPGASSRNIGFVPLFQHYFIHFNSKGVPLIHKKHQPLHWMLTMSQAPCLGPLSAFCDKIIPFSSLFLILSSFGLTRSSASIGHIEWKCRQVKFPGAWKANVFMLTSLCSENLKSKLSPSNLNKSLFLMFQGKSQ